ncbi:hypothetical protein ABVG11_25950 [Streptomyces sp. HD1123-B1]|uniref:hypothetical protein n=1 Tax=Streptomyces huangiella TaxID=3228804 RepID=UPI003D7C8EF8
MRRAMRAVAVGASAFCAVAFGGVSVAQAQSGPSGEALLASALGGTFQENDCGTYYGGVDLEAAVAGATGDTNVGSKCSNVRVRNNPEKKHERTNSSSGGMSGMNRPAMQQRPAMGDRAAVPQVSVPQISMPQTTAPQTSVPQASTMPAQAG